MSGISKMLIAKSNQVISMITKLAKYVNILKPKKGVPVAATSPVVAIPPVTTRVPVDTKPPVGATPPTTATPSSANTPNMPTNDGYWYTSHEGGRVPNDGDDGHIHASPVNEDNSTPVEIDEVVGIVGEPSNAGVVIKAPV